VYRRLFGAHAWGALANLFVLDDRQYRAHQACPRATRGGSNVVGSWCTERTAEGRQILANGRFGEFKSREVRRRSLPGSAAFAEVWAQHQVEPASRGTAYVYFFPQGMAEAARVTVADGDNVYTVVLHPLTGHARVVPGKPEVRR